MAYRSLVVKPEGEPMTRHSAGIITAISLAVGFTGLAVCAESNGEPLVVGQELTGISAPGVSGVIWTRRQDHYTLQIQLTVPPAQTLRVDPGAVPAAASASGNPYPDVRVQLRDSKGGQIPHMRRLAISPALQARPVVRGGLDGARRTEVIYTFQLSDGDHADTITLQINEREFTTKMPRLG
jgi:hypothetical protein